MVLVEFYASLIDGGDRSITFVLLHDSTVLGQHKEYGAGAWNGGVFISKRHTPTAASHTYTVKAFASSASVDVYGGAGGSGNSLPGYIRVSLAGG